MSLEFENLSAASCLYHFCIIVMAKTKLNSNPVDSYNKSQKKKELKKVFKFFISH